MMITKEAAYMHLLGRIISGVPLAWDGKKGAYDPSCNGGCAIGAHLGSLYEPDMDAGWGRTAVPQLFGRYRYRKAKAQFETPNSWFWCFLQLAHDRLACLQAGDDNPEFSHVWISTLKRAADHL